MLPTANEAKVSEVGVSCTIGDTAVEVKFTPVTLALFTVTLWLIGVNAKPLLLGVTV